MAEQGTEMILPGTYIEVRAEGLLAGGRIATGNIGIVGTAEMGSTDVAILSSYSDGRALFGEPGDWDPTPNAPNVHLVRALRYLFDNGARTVYARRALNSATAQASSFTLLGNTGQPLVTLRARTPGAWGNRLQIRVEEVETKQLVDNERVLRTNGALRLTAEALVPATAEEPTLGSVSVNDAGLPRRYQLQQAAPSAQVVQVNPTDRTLTFPTLPGAQADIYASYWVPAPKLRRITLRYGNVQEVYMVPSIAYLVQRLQDENSPSRLVTVDESTTAATGIPVVAAGFQPFSNGENGSVTLTHMREALDALLEQDIQLVVVVGLPFSEIKAALLGHVEQTENLGRERIAIVGADSNEVAKILENANDVADKRLVLVAPGLRERDPNTGQQLSLPPWYAAAAVAGRLSSFLPHISLTNKPLAGIDALALDYNYGELKALVQNRVLALQRKRGIRVVRGITTDDGAFQQISIRRIIDYIKEGTRQRCNQYIGLLNNNRVRENLRVTLDAFLADRVRAEFLTNYKLTVFADRAMEIRGEVLVTMDLQPTFSIDYIRVIMNLS